MKLGTTIFLERPNWKAAGTGQPIKLGKADGCQPAALSCAKIVKTFSMQALADLAEQDTNLRDWVIPILEELTETGSPAMRSRGRKLLKRLRSSSTTD